MEVGVNYPVLELQLVVDSVIQNIIEYEYDEEVEKVHG